MQEGREERRGVGVARRGSLVDHGYWHSTRGSFTFPRYDSDMRDGPLHGVSLQVRSRIVDRHDLRALWH